jgi:hypothetical protein
MNHRQAIVVRARFPGRRRHSPCRTFRIGLHHPAHNRPNRISLVSKIDRKFPPRTPRRSRRRNPRHRSAGARCDRPTCRHGITPRPAPGPTNAHANSHYINKSNSVKRKMCHALPFSAAHQTYPSLLNIRHPPPTATKPRSRPTRWACIICGIGVPADVRPKADPPRARGCLFRTERPAGRHWRRRQCHETATKDGRTLRDPRSVLPLPARTTWQRPATFAAQNFRPNSPYHQHLPQSPLTLCAHKVGATSLYGQREALRSCFPKPPFLHPTQ